jgi:hypothetical protein
MLSKAKNPCASVSRKDGFFMPLRFIQNDSPVVWLSLQLVVTGAIITLLLNYQPSGTVIS